VDDHRTAQYSRWTVLGWKRDIRVIGVASGNAEAMTAATRRPNACLISATLGQVRH
jgi:hypothetical protein